MNVHTGSGLESSAGFYTVLMLNPDEKCQSLLGFLSRGFLAVVEGQITSALPDEMFHSPQVHIGV